MKKAPIAHGMGVTIGRLMNLAQQAKALETTRPTASSVEAPTLSDAQKYRLACKQRDDFKNRCVELEKKYQSFRRAKLANFSADEIERELQRRLDKGMLK